MSDCDVHGEGLREGVAVSAAETDAAPEVDRWGERVPVEHVDAEAHAVDVGDTLRDAVADADCDGDGEALPLPLLLDDRDGDTHAVEVRDATLEREGHRVVVPEREGGTRDGEAVAHVDGDADAHGDTLVVTDCDGEAVGLSVAVGHRVARTDAVAVTHAVGLREGGALFDTVSDAVRQCVTLGESDGVSESVSVSVALVQGDVDLERTLDRVGTSVSDDVAETVVLREGLPEVHRVADVDAHTLLVNVAVLDGCREDERALDADA